MPEPIKHPPHDRPAEMSSKARKTMSIIMRLLTASILGILTYYLIEGASAASSAPPIFAASFLILSIILIIFGIFSLLA